MNMFPNNRSASCPHCKENQLFPSLTILDELEPQKCESNNLQQTSITTDASIKQKISTDSHNEIDFINLTDVLSITPRDPKVDKEKQITDFQIKMLEEFLSTTGSKTQDCKTFTPEREKEFHKFCDRYEAGTKSDVGDGAINKVQAMEKGEASSLNFYTNNFIGTPIILVPKLDKELDEENSKVDEDLIDELLLEKNLAKRHLRCPINVTNGKKIGQISTPLDTVKVSYTDNFDITKKNMFVTGPVGGYLNSSKLNENAFHTPITKNITKTCALHNPISKNTAAMNLNSQLITNKEIYPKSYPNIDINELVTKHNIKYLEPIKKDEKTFKKRSLLKSEVEKMHLTPGPTLHEKSVVLPQIMQRLSKRKKKIEELNNFRRKLMLDAGPSHFNTDNKANKSIQTTLNVNPSTKTKEPPKDNTTLQNRPSSVSYVLNSNQFSSSSNTKNKMPASKDHTSVTANGRTRSDFISLEKLRAIRREQNLAVSGPEMLTNDCNKERYFNYATSRLFEDFIHGK